MELTPPPPKKKSQSQKIMGSDKIKSIVYDVNTFSKYQLILLIIVSHPLIIMNITYLFMNN